VVENHGEAARVHFCDVLLGVGHRDHWNVFFFFPAISRAIEPPVLFLCPRNLSSWWKTVIATGSLGLLYNSSSISEPPKAFQSVVCFFVGEESRLSSVLLSFVQLLYDPTFPIP
jgi:hypothetical protein